MRVDGERCNQAGLKAFIVKIPLEDLICPNKYPHIVKPLKAAGLTHFSVDLFSVASEILALYDVVKREYIRP